jgi:hypothetical protein
MGKVFGLLLIVAGLWVGLELYQHGPNGAFGGALARIGGAEPTAPREFDASTPQRAGAAVERAHQQTDDRYSRMLGE